MSTSGGGGSSTDYPTYVKEFHSYILRGLASDSTAVNPSLISNNIITDVFTDRSSNPYNAITQFPYTKVTSVVDDLKAAVRESVLIDQTTGELNEDSLKSALEGFKDKAVSEFSDAFNLSIDTDPGGNIAGIISNALSHAKQGVDGSISPAVINSGVIINSTSNNVKSQIKQIMTELLQEVGNEMLNFSGEAQSDISSVFNSAFSEAISKIKSAIDTGVTKALEIMGNSVISNEVDEYEANTRTRHLRSVSRTVASMAGAGAANSSAIKIGIGLQESERERDVNKYEADLKLRVFSEVLKYTIEGSKDFTNTYMINYQETMKQKLQQFISLAGEYIRAFIQSYVQYLQTILSLIAQYSEIYKTSFGQRIDQLNRQYLVTMEREHSTIVQFLSEMMNTYRGQISAYPQLASILAELSRMEYVMNREYYDKAIEFSVHSHLWKWNLWQNVGNILASAAGGVITKPDKPSPVASALGGALTGAAAGNMILPGPAGAGIGAAIGGILGAVSN